MPSFSARLYGDTKLATFTPGIAGLATEVQMDELDNWIVEALIQSKGCSSGVLYEEGKDPNLLLELLLAVSADFSASTFGTGNSDDREKNTNVFIVNGGAPEFFVLPGLANPVIWYNTSYVGKHLKLREIIMAEKGYESAGLALLFETLSRFYMSLGNESFARTCFFQSLIEMPSHTPDLDYYQSALQDAHIFCLTDQLAQGPEAAIVALYFGLAHELGHVYGPDPAKKRNEPMHLRSVKREDIRDALLKAGKDVLTAMGCEYLYGPWSKKARHEFDDSKSILNIGSLRSEIVSDWIGFQVLSRFIELMSARRGRKYNKKAFVSEILVGLFVLQLLEQCRHLAKHNLKKLNVSAGDTRQKGIALTYTPSDFLDEADPLRGQMSTMDKLIDFAAVHWVRVEFLKPSLKTCVLLHLFPDTFKLNGKVPVPVVSEKELARRQALASVNLEGYLSSYSESFMRLLASFENVSLFAAYLVTDSPPPGELNPKGGKGLVETISKNLRIHLARSEADGGPGNRRKSEIRDQFSDYISIAKHTGSLDAELLETYEYVQQNVRAKKGLLPWNW